MTIVKKIPLDHLGVCSSLDTFPIVHSSMVPNYSNEFYGTDNKEDFLINCTRLPSSWKYRSAKVFYKFNSSGLRMNKELSEVSPNFIAGFGCSHTLGVGVNLEDTWLHLLSNDLKIDYINAGVSGGSVKLCAINFFNMLAQIDQLPKIAAFAWPSSVRYCFFDGEFVFYLPRFIPKHEKFKYQSIAYENLLMTTVLDSEAIFYRNIVKTTCNRLGIKFAEVTFDYKDPLIGQGVTPIFVEPADKDLNLDHARDVRDKSNNTFFSHPGVRLHISAKDSMLRQIGIE